MRPHRRALLAGAMALTMLAAAGCAAQTQTPQSKIYVICKSMDPYWDTTKAGANEAGEEMALDVTYIAPQSEDELDRQIQMIDEALADGAQALVIAPLDTDALNDTLARAVDAGVPVLTIDSDVSFEGRSTCISTQNLSAGAIAARAAANFVDGSGEVGIICHKANAQTAIERKGGFVDEIEGSSQKADTPKNDPPKNDVPDDVPSDVPGDTPDGEAPAVPEAPAAPAEETQSSGYPGMKIVETKYCEGNIELSKAGTIQLLSEHPDLKVIYATNQPGTVGACQAIDELGRADDITLVGFDYFDGADAYIQSGVLDAVIAQNPYNMGYLGVRYAKRLIDGETIAASVDTGATLITADNLQDADIRWLVDPTGKAGK